MKTRTQRITAAILLTLAATLVVAGVKISKMPRTTTLSSNSLIMVIKGGSGTSRTNFQMYASDMGRELGPWITNTGGGGGGSGDVTQAQLSTASNALVTFTMTASNDVYTAETARNAAVSNALVSLELIRNAAVSNAVVEFGMAVSNDVYAAETTRNAAVSNALVTLLTANDTTTSNGLFSVETTRNAAVSNALVTLLAANDITTSNALVTLSSNNVRVVGGTGGITVTSSGSGGVQTFTVNDDDAGGGSTTNFVVSTHNYSAHGSLLITNSLAYVLQTPVLRGTNLWIDGGSNALFEARLASTSGGLTNFLWTNLVDNSETLLWVWSTNGVTVGFPQFVAADFPDGAVVTPATNGWSRVRVSRRGSVTNIQVTTPGLELSPGASLVFSTNPATRVITADVAGAVTNGLRTDVLNLQGATNGLDVRLTTTSNALRTDITNLQGATNGLTTRATNLEGATNGLRTDVINLQGGTNGLNTRVANLDGATNGLTTRATNLEGATNGLRTDVLNLQGATNGLATRLANAEGATNGLTTRVNNLDGATNGLTSRVTAITNTFRTDVSNLQGATNGLTTRATNLEGATNGLRTDVLNLQGATNGLNTRLDNAEGATNGLTSRVTAITNTFRTDVTNLQGATNGLTTRATNLEGATNGLRTDVLNLQGATNGLATRLANAEGATNGLTTRVNNLDGATNGLTTRATNLEGATNGLDSLVRTKQHGTAILTNLSGTGAITNAPWTNSYQTASAVLTNLSGTGAGTNANTIWIATSGSDNNAGTEASPMASLNAAADRLRGNGTIIVQAGDYTSRGMRLNMARATNINIVGQRIVNVYGGTNVTSFTDEGGNRYGFTVASDSWVYIDPVFSPFIYIRGGGSQERFIPITERQPQQMFHNYAMRGYARLTNVASLPVVAGQWHLSNTTIRFIPPDGAAIGSRTIQLPERNYGTNSFLYGGAYYSQVEVVGIYAHFFYNGFDASTTKKVKLTGCRGLANYNCGFEDNDKEGENLLEFCEFGANGNDGVGTTAGGADSTNTVSTIGNNLWIHDNGDEGWSDHQGAYSQIENVLTEYNRGGGVTTFGGGRTMCNMVRSFANDYGFVVAGNPLSYNANWTNMYTMLIMEGCTTDQCRAGVSHDFSSANLFMEARNSYIGRNTAFGASGYCVGSDGQAGSTNTVMRLIDCTLEDEQWVWGIPPFTFWKAATTSGFLLKDNGINGASILNSPSGRLSVTAGYGYPPTNAFVGGAWWYNLTSTPNPTSNGTPANMLTIPIPAHMLTNTGDRVNCKFAGTMPAAQANTNQLVIVANNGGPNVTLLDTGLQTASNGVYEVTVALTRTGNSSHFVDARVEWGPGGGVPFLMTNVQFRTTTTTNGLTLNVTLQSTARRQGSLTNLMARSWFDPAPR